jgi:NAD+ synthase (glutamine-hydrolysing)
VDRIRVAACQVNTVVGDLSGNAGRILAALDEAERAGADLAVFPELAVTGYPPEDLLGRASFVDDNLVALPEVAASTRACAAVVGHVDRDPTGRLLNAASLCAGGRILGSYHKRILPNYGVFDEERWFVPGRGGPLSFVVGGVAVGMSVCEDMWFENGPMCDEADAGARVLINLNASPYSRGRREERLAVLAERVAETGCPVVYVNQVGGQDELVFDGASLVMGADGELLGSAGQFVEEVLLVDVEVPRAASGRRGGGGGTHADVVVVSGASRSEGLPRLAPCLAPVLGAEEEVYEALVLGTRDYVSKNGFSDAVIGLSGGIDSSLVATIAVDALGAEHVHGVTMPSRYSSEGSITDADALGANLGIEVVNLPIEDVHREFASTLAPALGSDPAGLTDENLQSRLRGVLLMALSNANGWIVLTTGNKSEMATGYSTLYGDSAGGFAVIKDVAKTLVYELCLHRNKIAGYDLVPEPILTKAPSAELRPDQRDEESLPPYPVLDPVIAGYVEGDRSADDLIAEGYDPAVVGRVVELVDRAEYKRRQMPPGVRISTKAFGRDRRMPITNRYRTGRPTRGAVSGAVSGGSGEEDPEVG